MPLRWLVHYINCSDGRGKHLVACSSCSEVIWVGYEQVEDEPYQSRPADGLIDYYMTRSPHRQRTSVDSINGIIRQVVNTFCTSIHYTALLFDFDSIFTSTEQVD
jgi:hypothetical protein